MKAEKKRVNWLKKVTDFIDYNRFIVIGPVVAGLIWLYAASCTPITESPITPGEMLTAPELQVEFKAWQAQQEIVAAKFEAAGQDLEQQRQNNQKIEELIINLAAGGAADLPGLVKLLFAGGALGAIGDNVRKRGLIAGLKKNA